MASDPRECATQASDTGPAFLFSKSDRVQHLKTKGLYTILETPEFLRIEDGNKPAYLYSNGTIQWVRPQSEMEDGRFILLERGSESRS